MRVCSSVGFLAFLHHQVISLGSMVHLSHIQSGWAVQSLEQLVATSWETRAFTGRPETTAAKTGVLFASLVSILTKTVLHTESLHTKNYFLHCLVIFSESGRTIVCEGRNTTLQCGWGQVLMIDGGFYGRKSVHYCRSKFPPPASPQHECSWADAVESITGKTWSNGVWVQQLQR